MVTVGIATIRGRESLIHAVIDSLGAHVDEIYLVLNGYESIPDVFQGYSNVRAEVCDNSLGDSAKFLHVNDTDGVYFSCDDDLLYPSGYVSYMISKIKQYGCIVTLHGRRYNRPVTSFKKGSNLNYHCLHTYNYDVELDIGGTGVMAFDTRTFRPNISEYKVKNMADIWTAKQAHEQGVRIMGVAHESNYLKYLNPKDTIWQNSRDTSVQTSVLQSFLK